MRQRKMIPGLGLFTLLIVPPQAGDAITCLHSTCSDGFCISQDAINTETIDCDTLGASDNNCALDVCEVRKVTLCRGCETQTLHKCRSSCLADKSESKCTVTSSGLRYYGDEPFSRGGLTTTSNAGSSYQYHCCTADACNTETLAAAGGDGDGGDSGTNTSAGQIDDFNGWYYAQDPSWQIAGGRDCICDPSSFSSPCTPNLAFNPLLPAIPAADIGTCHLLDEENGFTSSQRRFKLEGTGGTPGFAEGTPSDEIDRWKAYCVYCDGANGSAVHWYTDNRCSIAALVKSMEISVTGECTEDPSRGVANFHYKAVCNGVDPHAGTTPCPGTVPNNNVLSVGVYTNSRCRGTGVGRDWAVRLTDLPSLTAGPKCLRFADLEMGQGELGQTTHLLNEILATGANFASSQGFDTGLYGPASKEGSGGGGGDNDYHLPSRETLSLQLCASASTVTIAWFSDLACTRPAAFKPASSMTAGVAAPTAPYTVTGLTYQLGQCVSATDLPYRSSISDGSKLGVSGTERWLFAEWNKNASLTSSCPALAPAPPPDRDCVGTWSDCTDACEKASARIWTETTAQRGDGSACPGTKDCLAGVGGCKAAVVVTTVGIGIGALMGAVLLIVFVLAAMGVLHRRRLRRRVIAAMQNHAVASPVDMQGVAKKLKGKAKDAVARKMNGLGGDESSSDSVYDTDSSADGEGAEVVKGDSKEAQPSKQQGNANRDDDDITVLSSGSSDSGEWSGGLHKTPYAGGRGRGYGRARSRATSMLRGRGRAMSRDAAAETKVAQQQAAKERAKAKAAAKVRAKQKAEELVAAQVKQNAQDRARAKAAAKAASRRMQHQNQRQRQRQKEEDADLTEAERAMLELEHHELEALRQNMQGTYAHFPSPATNALGQQQSQHLPFAEVD